MAGLLQSRLEEFGRFVWDHAADAFQAKFDTRATLVNEEVDFLVRLLGANNMQSVDGMTEAVRRALSASPQHLNLLLQMTGLTRNKILQDLKGYARSRSIRLSLSKPAAVFNSPDGAHLASAYLAKQILRVFGQVATHDMPQLLEAINQATWLGYIRQERAKRMGHEAEYRLACLLRDCGISFDPAEKASNPLCRDAQVQGVSYDIVTPSLGDPLMLVKATIHTANIGQYGESKDDLEMRQAKSALSSLPERDKRTLLAFVDGVGFESNRAGLEGVLSTADEFCQFRTIWKAVVIAASKVRRPLVVALPDEQVGRFEEFCRRYHARLHPLSKCGRPTERWMEAGDAKVAV
jgi:hypothetical protein